MVSLDLYDGDKKNDRPDGHTRWLISIALSVMAVVGTIGTAVFGFGGQANMLQQNSKDIERILERETKYATKEDTKRIEDKLEELNRYLRDKNNGRQNKESN